MNPDDLLDFLARAAADPDIALTEAQAARIYADFMAGRLDAADLPLPLEQAVRGVEVEDIAAALATLALLPRGRTRARVTLRERFQRTVDGAAVEIGAGRLDLAAWQALMQQAVVRHLVDQAAAGAQGDAATLARVGPALDAEARTQTAYLSRFADTLAAAALLGVAWSEAAIAARSDLYGGAGWGWWFRANETRGAGYGQVVKYRAVDDRRTCGPCSAAERDGPYRVGEGPWPGQVCAGGGRCRCTRETVYDLDAYRRLYGV